MAEITIKPTHTCFNDALEFIEESFRQNDPLAEKMVLVHAVCVAKELGKYSHAWIEFQGSVITKVLIDDVASYIALDQQEYYASFRVQKTTKYVTEDIWRMNRLHGTFGPWEQEYIDLCRENRECKQPPQHRQGSH